MYKFISQILILLFTTLCNCKIIINKPKSLNERRASDKETLTLKLKNGKNIVSTITRNGHWVLHPNADEYFEILKEVSQGNKENINKNLSHMHQTPLCIGKAEEMRYLIEQGADPNQIDDGFEQSVLPLERVAYYNKDSNATEDTTELYTYNYTYQAVILLAYGAKIKLKDWEGLSAYKWWMKNEISKIFLEIVCKSLIKEEDISKLDPEFISLCRTKDVNEELITKIIKNKANHSSDKSQTDNNSK